MTNPLLNTGLAVGKIAARQALSIGKEAYADSKTDKRSFQDEFLFKLAERADIAREEAVEAVAYLRQRPGRAVTLAVSGVLAAVSYYLIRTRRV